MTLDPEQMRQRRVQRQQQREKERKKTLIKMATAGCFLLLSAAVILATINNPKSPSQTPQDTTAENIQNTQPSPADPENTVIHLAVAGDLNVTEAVVNAGGSDYNYEKVFLDVAPLLANADITALNFEGSLYGAPYGSDRSAPQSMAQALSNAGVDLVQLANSYSIYKGMDGLSSTINGIRSAGMEPLGVYESAAAAKKGKGYTICNVQGISVAFVAFTKGMDGMALPPGNDGCVNLLYTDYASDYQEINVDGITKILSAVAKEKPDITVALLHWGSEYNDTISTSQNDICTLMQENGVDAIIGTHSHYVQQMTLDASTGNFIAYSLGDFFGDATRSGSEYSVILDLEITQEAKSGKTKITNFSYTPIFTVAEKDKPLRVLRIDDAMAAYDAGYIDRVSEDTYKAMEYALTRIEKRISGE